MLVGPLAVPAKRKYVRAAEGEEEEEGIEVPEEERERIRYLNEHNLTSTILM